MESAPTLKSDWPGRKSWLWHSLIEFYAGQVSYLLRPAFIISEMGITQTLSIWVSSTLFTPNQQLLNPQWLWLSALQTGEGEVRIRQWGEDCGSWRIWKGGEGEGDDVCGPESPTPILESFPSKYQGSTNFFPKALSATIPLILTSCHHCIKTSALVYI